MTTTQKLEQMNVELKFAQALLISSYTVYECYVSSNTITDLREQISNLKDKIDFYNKYM